MCRIPVQICKITFYMLMCRIPVHICKITSYLFISRISDLHDNIILDNVLDTSSDLQNNSLTAEDQENVLICKITI